MKTMTAFLSLPENKAAPSLLFFQGGFEVFEASDYFPDAILNKDDALPPPHKLRPFHGFSAAAKVTIALLCI